MCWIKVDTATAKVNNARFHTTFGNSGVLYLPLWYWRIRKNNRPTWLHREQNEDWICEAKQSSYVYTLQNRLNDREKATACMMLKAIDWDSSISVSVRSTFDSRDLNWRFAVPTLPQNDPSWASESARWLRNDVSTWRTSDASFEEPTTLCFSRILKSIKYWLFSTVYSLMFTVQAEDATVLISERETPEYDGEAKPSTDCKQSVNLRRNNASESPSAQSSWLKVWFGWKSSLTKLKLLMHKASNLPTFYGMKDIVRPATQVPVHLATCIGRTDHPSHLSTASQCIYPPGEIKLTLCFHGSRHRSGLIVDGRAGYTSSNFNLSDGKQIPCKQSEQSKITASAPKWMWWGAKGHMRKITSDWLPLLMVGLCLSNSYIRRLKNHIIRPLASKRSMTAIREAFQQNVRSINLATVANDFTQEKLDTLRTTEREASDSGHLSKHELPWAAIPFADIGSNNHCDRGDSDSSECEFPIHQQSATSATIQNELYPGRWASEQSPVWTQKYSD